MLVSNMSLMQMTKFKPNDEDMAMLPLDVVTYLKACIISLDRKDNYDFLRFLFQTPDIKDYIKDISKTIIYDFDGTATRQEKFVTIFEMYGLVNFERISSFLKETLELYSHEADVLIDIYTHDNKEYRLSNLDGIVQLEEMNAKK